MERASEEGDLVPKDAVATEDAKKQDHAHVNSSMLPGASGKLPCMNLVKEKGGKNESTHRSFKRVRRDSEKSKKGDGNQGLEEKKRG